MQNTQQEVQMYQHKISAEQRRPAWHRREAKEKRRNSVFTVTPDAQGRTKGLMKLREL